MGVAHRDGGDGVEVADKHGKTFERALLIR
jgi:hypothetical protein